MDSFLLAGAGLTVVLLGRLRGRLVVLEEPAGDTLVGAIVMPSGLAV